MQRDHRRLRHHHCRRLARLRPAHIAHHHSIPSRIRGLHRAQRPFTRVRSQYRIPTSAHKSFPLVIHRLRSSRIHAQRQCTPRIRLQHRRRRCDLHSLRHRQHRSAAGHISDLQRPGHVAHLHAVGASTQLASRKAVQRTAASSQFHPVAPPTVEQRPSSHRANFKIHQIPRHHHPALGLLHNPHRLQHLHHSARTRHRVTRIAHQHVIHTAVRFARSRHPIRRPSRIRQELTASTPLVFQPGPCCLHAQEQLASDQHLPRLGRRRDQNLVTHLQRRRIAHHRGSRHVVHHHVVHTRITQLRRRDLVHRGRAASNSHPVTPPLITQRRRATRLHAHHHTHPAINHARHWLPHNRWRFIQSHSHHPARHFVYSVAHQHRITPGIQHTGVFNPQH